MALLIKRDSFKVFLTDPKADLLAGITVAIVALPLALAFGVASGMGAAAGITTAIIAGFVAALFGGSRFQVSGPTGAMTVVLIPIIHNYGVQGALLVGLMAGIVLVSAGLLKLGRHVHKLPTSLVEGFTAGIAVVIALQQVPFALDAPQSDREQVWWRAFDAVVYSFASLQIAALIVAVLVFVWIMLLTPKFHKLPLALIAVIMATLTSNVLDLSIIRVGDLPSGIGGFSIEFLLGTNLLVLIPAALAVAALGGLESLLSAKVADKMKNDDTKHNSDRELFGQGLANIIVPFFGGVPATAALARTAVNVKAGAKSRLAAMIHAVVLLLIILLMANLVSTIPLAALAGVLIATTAHMIQPKELFRTAKTSKLDALVLWTTFTLTVALDLVSAVVVGLALALALRKTRLSTRYPKIDEDETLGD